MVHKGRAMVVDWNSAVFKPAWKALPQGTVRFASNGVLECVLANGRRHLGDPYVLYEYGPADDVISLARVVISQVWLLLHCLCQPCMPKVNKVGVLYSQQ